MFGTFDGRPLGWRKFIVLLSGFPPIVAGLSSDGEPVMRPNAVTALLANVPPEADSEANQWERSMELRAALDVSQGRDPNARQHARTMTLNEFITSGEMADAAGWRGR